MDRAHADEDGTVAGAFQSPTQHLVLGGRLQAGPGRRSSPTTKTTKTRPYRSVCSPRYLPICASNQPGQSTFICVRFGLASRRIRHFVASDFEGGACGAQARRQRHARRDP
jgi:hypothetical protein